ncbi:GPI inositol-deacylase [Pseudomonas sp. Marseille-Q5115]|uniref:GPI inositol-deacylase n=1 Tax=Pseudomonas sp. Marseille-Q5115 TaxID=2866593 RepID=UPI001CE3DB2D|nr:GPI inositol-deacylase [Pseudomonas sp. Marseille-Q5115]
MNKHHPYHPIIYVRGFAATSDEIEETVADPYMGFNIGSSKSRQLWNGKVQKFFFESPMVRLKDEIVWLNQGMQQSERRYDDIYVNGQDLTEPDPKDPTQPLLRGIALPYQSIIIFRYYDEASETFGSGNTPPIQHFAKGLSDLILRVRALVCRQGDDPITGKPLNNEVTKGDFRCYLVAHSMGGLVARAFLQNPNLGSSEARKAVDKLFTYATPHNGIDLRIVRNVPAWATFGDANNFNRDRMADYFAIPPEQLLPPNEPQVSVLTNFPAERVFNLVGTNPSDYTVMKGMSAWAVGDRSDGLVRIVNATTFSRCGDQIVHSPAAFAHRSHSGHYGIVNSEEGYQNLTRFLFGTLRIDGILDIEELTLPADIQAEKSKGKEVRASYQFEIVASVRGSQWQMHRRVVRENSAIHRMYDELFSMVNGLPTPDRSNSPHLFSVFLDETKSVNQAKSVAFAFDLAVLVPDYTVDNIFWRDQHYEGSYIYRELILVEAIPNPTEPSGYEMFHGFQSETPNQATKKCTTQELPDKKGVSFSIPIKTLPGIRPGILAALRIEIRLWNRDTV